MHQEHPENLLPGYALGCLDEDDYLVVETHLRSCAECKANLRNLKEVTAQLAYAVPLAAPARPLAPRPFHAGQRARTYPWFRTLLDLWPRLLPAATLAAVMLVAVLGATNLLLWRQLESSKSSMERVQLVHLKATEHTPGATGTLLLSPSAPQALLEVSGLPPLQASAQYQLWLIKDGKRASGGVFSVSPDGQARLSVSADSPLDSYDALGITIEPFGGSPGPTGPKVLGGKFST